MRLYQRGLLRPRETKHCSSVFRASTSALFHYRGYRQHRIHHPEEDPLELEHVLEVHTFPHSPTPSLPHSPTLSLSSSSPTMNRNVSLDHSSSCTRWRKNGMVIAG